MRQRLAQHRLRAKRSPEGSQPQQLQSAAEPLIPFHPDLFLECHSSTLLQSTAASCSVAQFANEVGLSDTDKTASMPCASRER